jgi:hypothetical protein
MVPSDVTKYSRLAILSSVKVAALPTIAQFLPLTCEVIQLVISSCELASLAHNKASIEHLR